MRLQSVSTHHKRDRPDGVVAKRARTQNNATSAAVTVAQIAQDDVLSGAVGFLASTGLSLTTITQRLRAVAETIESGACIPSAHSEDFDLFVNVSSVLHDWVRGADFTGADGEPKALPLRGRRGLAALIRRRIPTRPMAQILRWMRIRKITRRRKDGRYLLLRRTLLVGRSDPLQLELAANFAALYLKSAVENWKETNPSARHFDRIARVFHLPEKEVPLFRDFVKRRTASWLEEMDNWLEDHDEPGRHRRVQAGVHVFGYVVGGATPARNTRSLARNNTAS